MTDALRDAEAASRELVMGFREGYASAWVMSGALDAYRDAIEARVREERDAEVRALEPRLTETLRGYVVRGFEGLAARAVLDLLATPLIKHFEEAQP